MTIENAVLKILEESSIKILNHKEITNLIEKNGYYKSTGKTFFASVSASLGNFIRNGDSRVKRIGTPGKYYYYLSKYENSIDTSDIDIDLPKDENINVDDDIKGSKNDKKERALHNLLTTFLLTNNIYTKTLNHQEAKKPGDAKWNYPDIIGVKLNEFTQEVVNFNKNFGIKQFCELYSYELKLSVVSDNDLKKCYFQALSNSNWANYGYLVAYNYDNKLDDELKRLNNDFGIGFIKLEAKLFESKILCPAKYKELSLITIDKLCKNHKYFRKYISNINEYMDMDKERLNKSIKADFEMGLKETDSDGIIKYLKNNKIKFDENEFKETM